MAVGLTWFEVSFRCDSVKCGVGLTLVGGVSLSGVLGLALIRVVFAATSVKCGGLADFASSGA